MTTEELWDAARLTGYSFAPYAAYEAADRYQIEEFAKRVREDERLQATAPPPKSRTEREWDRWQSSVNGPNAIQWHLAIPSVRAAWEVYVAGLPPEIGLSPGKQLLQAVLSALSGDGLPRGFGTAAEALEAAANDNPDKMVELLDDVAAKLGIPANPT